MKEEVTICVCCENKAKILFNPIDVTDGLALCLEHAKDFQQIINHLGNYPVCQVEVMTE